MESSEENSGPKPHADEEEKPTPHQELGLGFQPSSSIDPDQGLDSPIPPPSDALDHQTTSEKLQLQHQHQQIVDQEHQRQPIISEEFPPIDSEETQNQKAVVDEEELRNLELEEEMGNANHRDYTKALFEEFHAVGEELRFQQSIEEDIRNLVLEEREKTLKKGFDEKGTDREIDDAKGEEGMDYVNQNDDVGNRSENEKEDDGNRSVNEKGNGDDRSENEKEDDGNRSVNEKGNGDDRSENEKVDDEGHESVEGETDSMTGSKEGRYRKYHHPVRPDAEDCSHYMRTGSCKYGSNCKYNHPARRKNQAAKEKVTEKVKEKEENAERPGHTECKYHLNSGGCKFGKACRYKHSIRKTPVAPIIEFNFLGLPIRLGEKECSFYMRNGSCKYGSNCRFNHPDPTAVGGGDAISGYGNGGSVSLQGPSQLTMSSWSSPGALNENGPFVPVMFPPTQGVPSSYPERNGYQWPGNDQIYPTPSERRLPTPPAFTLNSPAETNFYAHHQPPMLIDEFPERPGQPECIYFLKTGNCKYKSGCKYHHPKNRLPKTGGTSAPTLSDKGLPQRPDQKICSHYDHYGICKFGPACRFDHPVNYGPPASSPGFVAPDNSSSFGNSAAADDGWE